MDLSARVGLSETGPSLWKDAEIQGVDGGYPNNLDLEVQIGQR